MRTTMQNTGMVASIAAFFAVIVFSLSHSLPAAFASSLTAAGAPQLIHYFTSLSPTESLFSAFLGYNPVASIIAQLPHSIAATLSNQALSTLTGLHWFPSAIAPSFMSSLHIAFYVSAGLAGAAAIASLLRGKRYIHDAALGEAQAKAQMSSGKASKMNSTVKTDA